MTRHRAGRPIDVDTTFAAPTVLAFCLAERHGELLRYVAAWKRWMAWDGARWREDDTLLVRDLARGACDAMMDAVRRNCTARVALGVARRLGGTSAPAQIERLAQTDRRLAARPEQFDNDPDLLNTPAGIVDTRTGAMLPHRPDAYMTRIAAVAPAAPGAACPLWAQWIDRLAGGDAELAFYLQRVAGRALTGRDPAPALGFAPDPARRFFIAVLRRITGEDIDAVMPDADGDLDFMDWLPEEYPAILGWAIEGCLAWRRIGLAPPQAAREATQWRHETDDRLGRFLAERAETSPAAWTSAGDLYAGWLDFADRLGADAGSRKRFSQALEARGFAPKRRRTGQRGFLGLALRPAMEPGERVRAEAHNPSSVIAAPPAMSGPQATFQDRPARADDDSPPAIRHQPSSGRISAVEWAQSARTLPPYAGLAPWPPSLVSRGAMP